MARRLKALRAGGPYRPLFLIHTIAGGLAAYASLIRSLDESVPLFGVEAVGRNNWGEPDTTIPAMARSALQAVRRAQGAGPYQLCGYSLGGAVAYEMARQLVLEQEQVHLLALIDTMPISAPGLEHDDRQKWLTFWSTVSGRTTIARALPTSRFWSLGQSDRLAMIWHEVTSNGGAVPYSVSSLQGLTDYFHFFAAMWRAQHRFAPEPCVLPLVYFETARSRRHGYGRRWSDLTCGRGETVAVPGTHMAAISGRLADNIAAHINSRLDCARSEGVWAGSQRQ